MGFIGGQLPEPSQKHESWMKQALCGSQRHSGAQSQQSPDWGRFPACPGGNKLAQLVPGGGGDMVDMSVG